jgi:hypothetical protein
MYVQETFYRPPEVAAEPRHLPAAVYNLALRLLRGASTGSVFVPIRSMQVLAVLDAEEFIFVDREGRRRIELAWREFRPQARAALDEPVPYRAVYYSPAAARLMGPLQAEFGKALQALGARLPPTAVGGARILPFGRES